MKTRICKNCEKEFLLTNNNRNCVFCSRSCSATFNGKKGNMPQEQRDKITKSLKNYYLLNPVTKVSKKVQSKKVGNAVKTGKLLKNIYSCSSRTTKKIIERFNLKCCICGWNESTCDIHHINGRNIEDCHNHNNLTILCPNHHRLVHNGKLDKNELVSLDIILSENWNEFYYG
jgi:hypothetical protein